MNSMNGKLGLVLMLGASLFPASVPFKADSQSPARSASGFFRVVQKDNVWWLLTPNGEQFFSLGVDVVDRGSKKKNYQTSRPEYASFLFYRDDAAWARGTLERLRSWGFNTLGAWQDEAALRKATDQMLPYTIGLWMGQTAGVPWKDLFSPETERIFDQIARRICLPRKNDPLLIGYFTDNELGWWDETAFLYQMKQPPNHTRKVIVDLMKRHYGGDWSKVTANFEIEGCKSFQQLEDKGVPLIKPGGDGRLVVDQFEYLFARKYYQMAHDAIRRYDKNHLILGDRYIAWYIPSVARAAGPYVDVISTNYNPDWTDGNNARFHFERLYKLTRKPVMVTEFYFCADENRSGNKNSHRGFMTVKTQKERAQGLMTNALSYLRLPYVVGAHWFQYYDEPTMGRKDGEDFNMGLVDIHNRPYEGLVSAAARVSANAHRIHSFSAQAQGYLANVSYIPNAPNDPESGLDSWDKERGLISSVQDLPDADLYVCAAKSGLWLAVHTSDYLDQSAYAGGKLDEQDRAKWTIRIDPAQPPIVIRFGPGGDIHVNTPEVRCQQWIARTRLTAIAFIPAKLLRPEPLHPADTIRIFSTLMGHSRSSLTTWQQDRHWPN